MKFQVSVIEKDGITFAIVKVEKHVFDVPGRARDMMASVQPAFPKMSVVFVSEDPAGTPAFYGRPDIVRMMTDIGLGEVEWKEYSLNEVSDDGNC